MRSSDELAAAVVKAWTRAYTTWVSPTIREARRAEIDSDLWEHTHAAREAAMDPRTVAGQILARCLLGIAADLTWRIQLAVGADQTEKEEIPMSERVRRNWWIPAPIMLIGLGILVVLTHVVGDGFESAWSRTTSGWNPSPLQRVGSVALLGLFFVVLPVWALVVRRQHPGLTLVMLLPVSLVSLVPLMWGDAGWWTLVSLLGVVTIGGAIVNLARRSLEERPELTAPPRSSTLQG